MPEPNLDHQSSLSLPVPQRPTPVPVTVQRHGGLAPPLFLPPEIRADLQPLFDVQTSLHLITTTPDFSEETREFLIDCIDLAIDGVLPEDNGPPTPFTLPALRLHAIQERGRMDPQWAQRLTQAARRDISRSTCPGWPDLMLYCRYAAEPLGRAVLERCDLGSPDIDKATDALTAALLVMHLMRRAGEDWRLHGRCFLPTEWIAEEGGSSEQLVERCLTPALSRVRDRMVERIAKLLEQVAPLPGLLKTHPALKAETVRLMIHARYQLRQLRQKDMLATRLRTPKWLRLFAYLRGWQAARG